MSKSEPYPGSFRDTSGRIYKYGKAVYRTISSQYKHHYTQLMTGGLYGELVTSGYLIPHEEVTEPEKKTADVYKIIKPQLIPFISYPYEWCFSQIKDAALTVLAIQKIAMRFGMTLKDASAYNIQFINGKPVWIDTLSFESYDHGPWIAYKQFCEHFLAPLVLMKYRDQRLNQLLKTYLDGIPLDLAASLLPVRAKILPSIFIHINLHAKAQRAVKNDIRVRKAAGSGGFTELVNNLEHTVLSLSSGAAKTVWRDYYDNTNYSELGLETKKQIIRQTVDLVKPDIVWDIGSNTGLLNAAANKNTLFVAMDNDWAVIEKSYNSVKKAKLNNIFPLIIDLANPSPAIGWHNQERESLIQRGPADMILALAIIHHLVITYNIPLDMIASFLASVTKHVLIEYIPQSDSQVQKLLSFNIRNKRTYTKQSFEKAFGEFFTIRNSYSIPGSQRTIYLLKKK